HPGAGGGVRHPGHPAGRGRPAAVPAVRAAPGPLGPRLPPDERPPTTGDVTAASGPGASSPGTSGPAMPPPATPTPGTPVPAKTVPVSEVLVRGEMTVHGRIAGSSNATLLVTCTLDGAELLAVYKPARGERPLWDFPGGLHRREVAAYRLSEALGWGLVPETVEREV